MHVLSVQPENIFQALSDPTRIRIIRLLVDSKNEACLCEMAESLGEPEYKLSRHVKVLRQTGLLSAEKDGRWIYHRLVTDAASLRPLYKFVQNLADTNNQFRSDLKRFTKRKKNRLDGRCRTEFQNSKVTFKKAKS
jgi:ArsR family transcriptional regulator